jgi:copper chaperone
MSDEKSSVTTTFEVLGMTCGHCVSAVTTELTDAIPGITGVQIDLASGRVVVSSDRQLDKSAIAAAVDEAGYQLAGDSQH